MADRTSAGRGGSGRTEVDGEQATGGEVGTALIQTETRGIRAVQYTLVDGECIVEGDISLGTEEEVARETQELRDQMTRAVAAAVVVSGDDRRWPDCRVPFTIHPALPEPNRQRVNDAIAHWEARTSYRFVPHGTEDDFVTFSPGDGCSSRVGRRGIGEQFVKLTPGCGLGATIHEIGHTVGLWHEQSREDRDAFVVIHWDKIEPGHEHNFNQHIVDGDDVGPYDYDSIMHYSRTAFSVDGSDTITPIDPNAQIGQRNGLSPGDIAAAQSICARRPTLKEFREPPTLKEFGEPTLKEFREPPTLKEFREPTLKEFREPTLKEFQEPTLKEFQEPTLKGFQEPPLGPPPAGVTGLPHAGALPFAVATPHQASGVGPGMGQGSDMQAYVSALEARLGELAVAVAHGQANQAMLEQEYAQTAALLHEAIASFGYRGPG